VTFISSVKYDLGIATFNIPPSAQKVFVGYCMATLGAVALFLHPLAALAQVVVPSQLTPQTLRPAAPGPTVGLPSSDSPQLQAPAGAEGLSFVVGRLVIQGPFPELDTLTRALVRTVEGHRVTVAQVYEFASALEQAYARAGYVLVRVTVPQQKLIDHGPLRIVIVDGFVEAVQVDNVPDRIRALVTSRVAALVGRRHTRLDEIERRLLIAGDVPGLRLKSTLARGKTPGGVLLVLEGTHRLLTATASLDNRLPSSLGTWSFGTGVAVNSAFGFGDQFYASAQSSGDPALTFDSSSPFRVLGAGAALPLGTDGWILNPEYTYSRSHPLPASNSLASIGQFERFALRISYPLMRTRTNILNLNSAFEYINQSVALPLFAADLNKDRYGAIRIGAAYETGLPWSGAGLLGSATFSQGAGGRDNADALASGVPLSRQGADPYFSKLTFDARITQALPNDLRMDFIARAQTSFGKPLLVSEQFSLDGPQAVSVYPSGSLNVDEGGTLRVELSRSFGPVGAAVPMILLPYAFGSFGIGRLVEPTVLERAVVSGGAVGVGVRSGIDNADGYQGFGLGVEIGRQFSNLPNLAHSWRGQVIMSFRF
jgi:hemolysin activation/secretion protein